MYRRKFYMKFVLCFKKKYQYIFKFMRQATNMVFKSKKVAQHISMQLTVLRAKCLQTP
jgi:hypothetical protein